MLPRAPPAFPAWPAGPEHDIASKPQKPAADGTSDLKAIIFDLDGTLVDSVAALQAIASQFMDEMGWRRLEVAEARGYIGHGSRWFLEQALRARDVWDPDQFETRFHRFHEIYASAPGSDNHPYPTVGDVLARLGARDDIALGLCTNKPKAPTHVVLDAHGWTPLFDCIIAGDELPERKPHPLPLQTVVQRTGATEAVYIGDSEVDCATAAAAGIPFVFFTEGYCNSPLDEASVHARFSDFSELMTILDRF